MYLSLPTARNPQFPLSFGSSSALHNSKPSSVDRFDKQNGAERQEVKILARGDNVTAAQIDKISESLPHLSDYPVLGRGFVWQSTVYEIPGALAVKILTDPSKDFQLLREAKMLQQADFKNAPRLIALLQKQGRNYLVMTKGPGQVPDIENNPYTQQQLEQTMNRILRLDTRGVLHPEIHAHHILTDSANNVSVLDYENATAFEPGNPNSYPQKLEDTKDSNNPFTIFTPSALGPPSSLDYFLGWGIFEIYFYCKMVDFNKDTGLYERQKQHHPVSPEYMRTFFINYLKATADLHQQRADFFEAEGTHIGKSFRTKRYFKRAVAFERAQADVLRNHLSDDTVALEALRGQVFFANEMTRRARQVYKSLPEHVIWLHQTLEWAKSYQKQVHTLQKTQQDFPSWKTYLNYHGKLADYSVARLSKQFKELSNSLPPEIRPKPGKSINLNSWEWRKVRIQGFDPKNATTFVPPELYDLAQMIIQAGK